MMDGIDPAVMYLIVRESLGMGPGKIGAQCAHACQMVFTHYMQWKDKEVDLGDGEAAMMQLWLQTLYRKIVLRADDKEWEKLKGLGLRTFVVKDSGLTEVAAGSETVMAVWPMLRSLSPKTLKRLQAL